MHRKMRRIKRETNWKRGQEKEKFSNWEKE